MVQYIPFAAGRQEQLQAAPKGRVECRAHRAAPSAAAHLLPGLRLN